MADGLTALVSTLAGSSPDLLWIWAGFAAYLTFSTTMALVHVRRLRKGVPASPTDTERADVTVVVPAFNEAECIERCLASILGSTLLPSRIIVVDDGSLDETSHRAVRAMCEFPGGRVISMPSNRGKAHALNRALEEVASEFLFTLDADTSVDRETIWRTVATLRRCGLDAVACHVTIEAPHGLLGVIQDVEYEGSLQIDRLMQAHFGIITTVPGAGGLYRTEVVRTAGGFSARSTAEDTDLTLSVQRRKARVGTAIDARVRTLPPPTLQSLIRQRERWIWGNLTAFAYHAVSRETGHARFYALVLPMLFLFNGLSPILYLWSAVAAPAAMLSGGGIEVPVGATLLIGIAIARCRIAYRAAGRSAPGLWCLAASVMLAPLIVSVAAVKGGCLRLLQVSRPWE